MIFIDSNVPMYLVGAAHPNKEAARRVLERLTLDRERLATDVEVLQEILHRYGAIARKDAIEPAFDALLGLVDQTFDIGLPDVLRAKELLLDSPKLSARDCLHLAVMEREGIERIVTFDRGFDAVTGIERLSS